MCTRQVDVLRVLWFRNEVTICILICIPRKWLCILCLQELIDCDPNFFLFPLLLWTMIRLGILRVFKSINELIRVPPLHVVI